MMVFDQGLTEGGWDAAQGEVEGWLREQRVVGWVQVLERGAQLVVLIE